MILRPNPKGKLPLGDTVGCERNPAGKVCARKVFQLSDFRSSILAIIGIGPLFLGQILKADCLQDVASKMILRPIPKGKLPLGFDPQNHFRQHPKGELPL